MSFQVAPTPDMLTKGWTAIDGLFWLHEFGPPSGASFSVRPAAATASPSKARRWSVTQELGDPAMVLGDERPQDLSAQLDESARSPSFVRTHKEGIADYIGGQDGGKPAFQALSPSPRRLTIKDRGIHAVGLAVEWQLLAMSGPDSP